ncbi:F-box only protein 9 [Halocaridina rubra]|uniref:F-box only protein 9 n=1 Tax=Halocaridina rubra TaxID=373956 RepID=A0AAN8XGJ3_HALRR
MADTTKSAKADDDITFGDLTEQNEAPQSTDQEDPESVLASFRKEWRRELESHGSSTPGTPSRSHPCHPRLPQVNQSQEESLESLNSDDGVETDGESNAVNNTSDKKVDDVCSDIELKATELFNRAVELEQSKRLYEAIQHYRRAMTLVPDIEFRVHRKSMLERNEVDTEESLQEEDLSREEFQDLIARFQLLVASTHAVCIPQFEQEAPHISCLPPEMLDRIMCWVVGNDLDMRSLEQVAQACRGFYLVARNPEIWHKACLRVWGINCGLPGPYGSWREMFIERPHPRYNGCYISRTTYFRQGDCSFQDQNYQPWHLVQYYRYVRFFTDGTVSMLTTPEEPQSVVSHLRTRDSKISQVVRGHYRIHGSVISLLLKKKARERNSNRRKGRRHFGGTTDVAETIFQIEYDLRSPKDRLHWILAWRNYIISYITYDNKKTVTDVDVNDVNKFPTLAFSRVKSYALVSDVPLC